MFSLWVTMATVLAVADGLGIPLANEPVKSEVVTVRSITKRSIDGSRQLHVRAFGEDHHLHLESADAIFSPTFEARAVRALPDGRAAIHNTVEDEINRMPDTGSYYTVKGQPGSLYVNDDNGLHVEGILKDGLRITPHSENGETVNSEMNHVVYQEDHGPLNDLPTDYVIPPNVSNFQDIDLRQGVPGTVNVEIHLLFDFIGTRRLGFDDNKIKRYIGIFWNRINQLYTQTNNPRINLVLAGLTYFKNPQDQPFINNNQVDENRALESLLGAMGKWLKDNEKTMPRYDVAFLQLNPDIGKVENGQFRGTVGGVAYMGGTCNYVEYKCGYGQDRAPSYFGLGYAAHELAHTLGAPHDSDVDGCRNDKGFIMSGGQNWRFSKCSLQKMSDHVRGNNGKCTWDSPSSRVGFVNAQIVDEAGNLDEQCVARTTNMDQNIEYKGGQLTDKICEGIWCGKKGQGGSYWGQYSPEGTPCGQQKACKSGSCVSNNVPSLNQQCQHFGNDHVAWGANDPNICSRLWCTKDHQQLVSIGGAKTGSVCGGNGRGLCVSGKCYS